MIEFIDSYFFGEVSSIPYATLRVLTGLLFICVAIEIFFSYEVSAPIEDGGFFVS